MKSIVAIIVGSDSDLPVIQETVNILEELGIPFEITIGSAHRTPDRVAEFVSTASERGVKVIITGAGGAAHLPGVVASKTNLPVIGIPIDNSPLNGVDSLYSIVQMPGGIPVATMAIGRAGALNAGIFAAQIIALSDSEVSQKLIEYRRKMAESVKNKADKLAEIGIKNYIENKTKR